MTIYINMGRVILCSNCFVYIVKSGSSFYLIRSTELNDLFLTTILGFLHTDLCIQV